MVCLDPVNNNMVHLRVVYLIDSLLQQQYNNYFF